MTIRCIPTVGCCLLSMMLCGWNSADAWGQLIASDSFDDGDFSDGPDSMDLEWLEHGNVSLFIEDDNGGIDDGDALLLDRGGNAVQGARALLPEVLTLDENDQSIVLSFDFRFAEDPPSTNRGLRAGLFDTLGTDADLNDDAGYFLQLGTGEPLDTPGSNNAPHLSVRQELGLEGGPANGPDNVGVPNEDPSIFLSGVNDLLPHHASLTLTKTLEGVLASAQVDDDIYSLEFIPDSELWPGKFTEEFLTFDEVVIHGSKGPFDILVDNVVVSMGALEPRLQAGDADQDLDFDQLDLVKVQIAAKYLTGQAATWGEGDWDAAPGGEPGDPPPGSGLFDQLDIIAALAPGHYLTGSYAAVSPHPDGDGNATLVYDPSSGRLEVQAGATELTSINIDSAAGIFTGDPAANLGGSFDNDADHNIFKATFGSSFGSLGFGNVAQAGLSEEFVLGDLTVVGSLAGGGDLGDVDLVYVPEPTTALLFAFGLAIGRLHLRRFDG